MRKAIGTFTLRRSGWSLPAGILALCALVVPQTGAADYLGGGQQADVNAFLNPEAIVIRDAFGDLLVRVPITKAVTLVPSGPPDFPTPYAQLEFKFQNADASTFEAALGKTHLAFELVPGGVVVTDEADGITDDPIGVALSPSRNTVVASVVGTKPSGQRGRDADHITMICCVGFDEQPPVADAGLDQQTTSGQQVTLSGSGNDPNGDSLTFEWEQVGGPAVALSSNTSASPSFTAPIATDVPVILEFDLTVNDGIWSSFPDRVVITVLAGDPPPVANAGPDQSVLEGSIVTLDGSASFDPPDVPVPCAWTAPAGIVLSDPSSCITTFTAPDVVILNDFTFTLTVTDSANQTDTDEVTVRVAAINHEPTANAGPDQEAFENSSVTLDGSASSDPDPGDVLSFSWVQDSGPTVTLSAANSALAGFIAPAVGPAGATLVFTLTVTDLGGLSDSDSVMVTVKDGTSVSITGISVFEGQLRRTRR